jgi:MFS family permease
VVDRAVAASEAGGAKASGLSRLIWVHVLAFAADAMITVALAGTVFFGAGPGQQKGNILGYLLITMAPFALIAPVIGPVLDRLASGRRRAFAATAFGRAALAVAMAVIFHNVLALFPLALSSLVLSKAYGVIRATAAPRVSPPGMTLVSVNARLSIFGLCATVVGGGFIAGLLAVTRSYPLGLSVAAAAFGLTGWFAPDCPDASTRPAAT